METCFNYTDKNSAYFSSDERKWINHIRQLKEEHPDEVTILAEPEDNDGCIYCKLPADCLKIQFKRHLELTEEQKEERRRRLSSRKAE